MNTKIIIFAFILISSFNAISAQEINMKVTVNAPNLVTADKKITTDLKTSVTDFFNNTKWTEDEYEKEELIEASLNITILEDPSPNTFIANFSVQSERPVYNSSYSSIGVNISDKKILFTYLPQQAIENSTTSFYDHLSSALSFYAYTILAYDYDSFAQFGGDPYFNKAQDIINALPTNLSTNSAWDVNGKNNKGVMVKNMLNSKFRAYRQAWYEYHRLGLDYMHEEAEKAKAVILSCLNSIVDVNQLEPNSTAIQMFADSKRSEIIEIYKQSPKGQQKKVYNIMIKLDPSQANQYTILR